MTSNKEDQSATSDTLSIAVLPGDGIGPEIAAATSDVLEAIAAKVGLSLELRQGAVGWQAYHEDGATLSERTLALLRDTEGWIVGPTFAGEYPADDPIRGHPSGYLRRNFELFANLRPVQAWPQLNPLVQALDVSIIRENTEGFYPDRNLAWGYGEFLPTSDVAMSLRVISSAASRRIARYAYSYAKAVKQHRLTVVHKRTALPQTDGMFLSAFDQEGAAFPDIDVDYVRVDTFSSQLPREPERFKVVVTTNLFGDILSDQASGLAGGVGVAPSLNAGAGHAMAQAVHGTAADIAGKDKANPTALLMSARLLLQWFDQRRPDERLARGAHLVEQAVRVALGDGVCTPDLGGSATTSEYVGALIQEVDRY